MVAWQFRCKCCGELREAPMTRPEGTVYLRCIATRQWAWYAPSAFIAATGSAPGLRSGGNRAKAPRSAGGRARVAARATRGAAARRGTRVAARTARGGAGRKVARRARKRR